MIPKLLDKFFINSNRFRVLLKIYFTFFYVFDVSDIILFIYISFDKTASKIRMHSIHPLIH